MAAELLKSGEADFVYPYEKQFLDTSPILLKLFLETGNIEVLEQNSKKMEEINAPNPVGGAFLANVNSNKKSGLENKDSKPTDPRYPTYMILKRSFGETKHCVHELKHSVHKV